MSRNITTSLALLFLVLNVTIISSTDNKQDSDHNEAFIPSSIARTSTVEQIAKLKENDDSNSRRKTSDDTTYSTDFKLVSSNSLSNLYKRKNFYNKKTQQNKYLKILARQLVWDGALALEATNWNDTFREMQRMRASSKESNLELEENKPRSTRKKRALEENESLCVKLCNCTKDQNGYLLVYCEFNTLNVSFYFNYTILIQFFTL